MTTAVPSTTPGVYVDNSAVAGSGDRIELFDPSTGELLTSIIAASREDVDRAAQVATSAAAGWASLPPVERGASWLGVPTRSSRQPTS